MEDLMMLYECVSHLATLTQAKEKNVQLRRRLDLMLVCSPKFAQPPPGSSRRMPSIKASELPCCYYNPVVVDDDEIVDFGPHQVQVKPRTRERDDCGELTTIESGCGWTDE